MITQITPKCYSSLYGDQFTPSHLITIELRSRLARLECRGYGCSMTTPTRPAPTRQELESSLERYFRQAVRLAGGSAHKIAPVDKGVPDRLVLMPGGRMFLVELKTETGVVSPAQKLFHAKALSRGVVVVVLSGRVAVDTWVKGLFVSIDAAQAKAERASKRHTAAASSAITSRV